MDALEKVERVERDLNELRHHLELEGVRDTARFENLEREIKDLKKDLADDKLQLTQLIAAAVQSVRDELRPYIRTLNVIAAAFVIGVVGAIGAAIWNKGGGG